MDQTHDHKPGTSPPLRNRLLVFVPFLFLLLLSTGSYGKGVKLIFVGDIMLSRNVKQEIDNRKTSPWVSLSPEFQSADFVFGNLEGAVSDSSSGNAVYNDPAPVFGIPSSFIPMIHNAGFSALSVENNHCMDFGVPGRNQSIQQLLLSDIDPIYFDNSPQFFRFGETVVAIIAINLVPGKDHQCQKFPSVALSQKLRLAKNLANLVIISIHWGSELLEWPNKEQRFAAQWLIEHGADAIIGHHPHVVQQPEIIEGKPVFFSLGNHVFDQKYPATKEGLLVECILEKGQVSFKCLSSHTAKNSFFPVLVDSQQNFQDTVPLRSLHGFSEISLQAGPTFKLPPGELCLEAHSEGKKIWQTRSMSLVSIEFAKLDGQNDFVLTLERHYSNMDHENGLRPYVYSVDKDGLTARWRGSALAWPLLDAVLMPGKEQYLCARHRGDSFINPDEKNDQIRFAVYRWNGFGFSGVEDKEICKECEQFLK